MVLSLISPFLATLRGEGSPPAVVKQLLDLSSAGAGLEKQLTPQYGSEGQVSAARSRDPAAPGLVLTIQPGNCRPII